jgi:hypothetical protein
MPRGSSKGKSPKIARSNGSSAFGASGKSPPSLPAAAGESSGGGDDDDDVETRAEVGAAIDDAVVLALERHLPRLIANWQQNYLPPGGVQEIRPR